MAYLHCRTRIRTWTRNRIPNLMGTLYYAEVFTLVWIWTWIPTWKISQMVTVPILGMDLLPRDRCPFQFYYISIRGSESESEPMENFCIVQQSESEAESESQSGNVNKPLPPPPVDRITDACKNITLAQINIRHGWKVSSINPLVYQWI